MRCAIPPYDTYAAGVAGCKFVYVAHSEVAYAWGVENGLLDRLLQESGDHAGRCPPEAVAGLRAS
jgi:hypothetical protein